MIGGIAAMRPDRNEARYAGLLYGLAGLSAPFAYLYVPGILLIKSDALATVDRVRASEGLLRAAIVGELWGATVLILAALALYRLFESVDPKTSTLMAVMMLVSVPISYVNALINTVPLVLLKTPALLTVLGPGPTAAQVTLFLQLHNYGLVVNQILWGLWLFPVGVLVMRSGFIPRWLAYPLFVAGTGYVSNSLGALVLPPSLRSVTDSLQILGLGELPFFSFYLLIWGVRGYRVDRIAALLILISLAIGTVGLVLLLLHRIEPIVYGTLVLASLVALLGAVLRWRSDRRRPTLQTGAGT
jgi:hypothetical protein